MRVIETLRLLKKYMDLVYGMEESTYLFYAKESDFTEEELEILGNIESRKHILYENRDSDAPKSIKDSNGDVVLGMCKICGRAEVQLEHPCTIDE